MCCTRRGLSPLPLGRPYERAGGRKVGLSYTGPPVRRWPTVDRFLLPNAVCEKWNTVSRQAAETQRETFCCRSLRLCGLARNNAFKNQNSSRDTLLYRPNSPRGRPVGEVAQSPMDWCSFFFSFEIVLPEIPLKPASGGPPSSGSPRLTRTSCSARLDYAEWSCLPSRDSLRRHN